MFSSLLPHIKMWYVILHGERLHVYTVKLQIKNREMTNKISSGQVTTPTATRCNAVKCHIIVHMQAPVLFSPHAYLS